jgi:hypothetical protein
MVSLPPLDASGSREMGRRLQVSTCPFACIAERLVSCVSPLFLLHKQSNAGMHANFRKTRIINSVITIRKQVIGCAL